LLIKYIKRVLWRVVKRLSYIEDARCLKVNCDRYLGKHEHETHNAEFILINEKKKEALTKTECNMQDLP